MPSKRPTSALASALAQTGAALGIAGTLCLSGASAAATTDPEQSFKQGIDALAAIDELSVAAVDRALSTRLSKKNDNGSFTSYTAAKGVFAGRPIAEVELRCSNERAGECLLAIDLAEPGPPAQPFARRFWPQAEFTIASPHGFDSKHYWSARQGRDRISIGHPRDGERIVSLILNRMPDRQAPIPEPAAPLPPLPPLPPVDAEAPPR